MGGRAVTRALRVHLPRVGRVAQDAPDRGARPARRARRRGHAARIKAHGELHQRGPGLAVHREKLGDDRGLGRVGRDAARVARPIRVHAVAVRGVGPRQQQAGAQLGQPPAAHALGDQRALVLGHRAADLQQQVVVRVVAHRTVEELGGAAGARPLLQEHHLVHVVAGEAVGRRDEHAVDLAAFDGVAQAVEPWARQHGAAVAVVAEDVGGAEHPVLGGMRAHMRGQPLELLLNGLVVDLVAGRDASVDRYAHGTPPAGSGAPAPRSARVGSSPTAGGVGRPGPSAAGRSRSARRRAGPAKCAAAAAACSSPRRVTSPESWDAAAVRSPPRERGQFTRSRPVRVRQNLSFVIRPLSAPSPGPPVAGVWSRTTSACTRPSPASTWSPSPASCSNTPLLWPKSITASRVPWGR
jgi:hypothetical protein